MGIEANFLGRTGFDLNIPPHPPKEEIFFEFIQPETHVNSINSQHMEKWKKKKSPPISDSVYAEKTKVPGFWGEAKGEGQLSMRRGLVSTILNSLSPSSSCSLTFSWLLSCFLSFHPPPPGRPPRKPFSSLATGVRIFFVISDSLKTLGWGIQPAGWEKTAGRITLQALHIALHFVLKIPS